MMGVYKKKMKGYPKNFATSFDYRFILENYPGWRVRALKELRYIYKRKDDKATIATHPKVSTPVFSVPKAVVEEALNNGEINKLLRAKLAKVISDIPTSLTAVKEEGGWLIHEKGKPPIHALRVRKVGAYIKGHLTTDLEEEEWETEEVNNPMPLWKAKRFDSRADVKKLFDEFSGGVEPEPILGGG